MDPKKQTCLLIIGWICFLLPNQQFQNTKEIWLVGWLVRWFGFHGTFTQTWRYDVFTKDSGWLQSPNMTLNTRSNNKFKLKATIQQSIQPCCIKYKSTRLQMLTNASLRITKCKPTSSLAATQLWMLGLPAKRWIQHSTACLLSTVLANTHRKQTV